MMKQVRNMTGCLLMVMLLAVGGIVLPARGEAAPAIMLAGFQSRVAKTAITMTDIDTTTQEMGQVVSETLFAELSGNPKYEFYDTSTTATRARMDETALINQLGNGQINPELEKLGDYVIFGFITNVSNVKAQSGALGVGGKDGTVHVEISMRVMDVHNGAIVFATTANSRRKSELKYNVIFQRRDNGLDDALNNALEIAAQNLAAQFLAAV